mmetsp:Transcript_7887/g.22525  ORF Transcript_7887/g.22525 Transcript_7887/m.22525 type:complete len:1670 (-) Transcript_7887:66-5075(-)|eukprot:CAMPEP_0117654650 /NCGR_PEP_ID=MMETSP0804-20121206/3858_1 /TAXON_ID=1074897 /ORGANISM="Tetraselmis astigmatica, Strain CCMP880" /LENGTH=1669 /DNA_ID=CAMNT_0005460947 /DNA_START=111 /DNA_END=5120 /DNA_ORIENTATION=+
MEPAHPGMLRSPVPASLSNSSGGNDTVFIDGFCRPDLSPYDFKNQLGAFTPCFIEVALLTPSYIAAVVMLLLRMYFLLKDPSPKYKMLGSSRMIKISAVTASFACMSVPIMTLNGRLANSLLPMGGEDPNASIAPYECIEYTFSILAWLLFSIVQIREVQFYLRKNTWITRFPQILVLAANLAKAKFALEFHADGYFFYLFIAFCGLQLYLVLLACFFYPAKTDLDFHSPDGSTGYQALPEAPPEASQPQDTRQQQAEVEEEQSSDEYICPEYKAGILSKLTFFWLAPLLRLGYEAPLQSEDIWQVAPPDRVAHMQPTFQDHWKAEVNGRRRTSLLRAMWNSFGYFFKLATPLQVFNDVMQFGGPFFLNRLLLVTERDQPAALGYMYAFLMLLTTTAGTLADNQQFQLVMRAGFRLRAVLVSEVYRKTLFLSPSSRSSVSSGKIINLMTTDIEQMKMVCQNLLGLISAPIRIVIAMVMLYQQLGVASLVGLAVMVVSTPANSILMGMSQKVFKASLLWTDDRTKLVNDLISSIEVVKCMAWEAMLLNRVSDVRKGELAALWRAFKLQTWISVLLNTIPTLVSVVAFAVYVLLGNSLTAAKAFTSLTLFNQLRMPLFRLPQTITQITLAQVGLKRLQDFLLMSESAPEEPQQAPAPGESCITAKGNFTWDIASLTPTLTGIDLDIPAGSLVAVVGGTGSGKSSLLQALMGQMDQTDGYYPSMKGSLAYVPQSAFIFGGTVRENILFGKDFEQSRYNEAVDAACLMTDFEALPGGDSTELGDKGVNVSGGQKQRISIARAVYSGHDIVLLDDPLSALDAKVGRRVFQRGIKGYLKRKTVVLVTNQLQFVDDADIILYMKDGKIAEKGTYEELMALEGGLFAALMSEAKVEQDEESGAEKSAEEGDKLVAPDVQMTEGRSRKVGQRENASQLTAKEGRATGTLSMETITGYRKALGGRLTLTGILTSFFGQELARVLASLWLTFWTSSAGNELRPAPHSAYYYLAIYTAISTVQIMLTSAFSAIFKYATLNASSRMHDTMLHSLLRSPLSFFHTNPLGRIINRLTKDVSEMDKNIADSTSMFTRSLLTLISTCILMGSVSPMLLPFLAVVMVIFYFIYLYFQASVREAKRLESISYSPLYTSLTDAINGLASIRAYGQEQRLMSENRGIIDGNSRFALAQMSFNRWLSVRQESLGAVIAFIASVISIEERDSGSAAVLGLVVSYALSISSSVAITVRLASMAEVSFNSVDRVLEYCGLKPEAAEVIEGSTPPDWPPSGTVVYEGVKMRYREGLPLVLNGLDINIAAGSKCGVVGRTGAGKSSLINTLFRLMELDEGKITVDNIDIKGIGLRQLRQAISLIPQVPALFTGTLRFNLDPFSQYTDAQMWQAVKRAHLHQVVASNPAGLDMQLREGGSPFSMGQKQLVALARALLKSSKILVLDEATANVDVETDALIQKTIREEFHDCTLIAIAHRLHTIIESDMVVVMDAGRAVEIGKPSELLSNPAGVFSSMVKETGEATERFLRAVAFGETDIMVEELNEMAKAAQEEMDTVQDPKAAVEELAGMAQVATNKIAKVLSTLKECDEAETQLECLGSDVPESTRVLLDRARQISEAAGALQSILAVVSQLEEHLSAAEASRGGLPLAGHHPPANPQRGHIVTAPSRGPSSQLP